MEALRLVDSLLTFIDNELCNACPAMKVPSTAGKCPFSNATAKFSSAAYNQLSADLESLITSKGCAPILIRLAWHDAGTFCSKSNTGGPRAAQRFDAGESTYGANAGLNIARTLLADIQAKYCGGALDETHISIADLWAFAANTAIRVTGGPNIAFRFGRRDIASAKECVEDGRLPDGDKGLEHLRSVFGRIGFNDREIVCLSGAHTLGSCHADRSGFDGFWTAEPLRFDNSYFKDLLSKKWVASKASSGNPQLKNANDENDKTMMLISDYCLVEREETRPIVEEYAANEKLFFDEFAVVWQRLISGGYTQKCLYSVA